MGAELFPEAAAARNRSQIEGAGPAEAPGSWPGGGLAPRTGTQPATSHHPRRDSNVSAPAMPSTGKPTFDWNSRTAASVSGPKAPVVRSMAFGGGGGGGVHHVCTGPDL